MNSVKIFNFEGSNITFKKGDITMVNATEMAKPFGKSPKHWLVNTNTNEFLSSLSKVRNLTLVDLVQVTHGGENRGTWMQEDVALEFARWLSPAFAIWCNDKIKELLQTGSTILETLSPKEMAKMWLAAEEDRERLQKENERKEAELRLAKPKVEYMDRVIKSDDLIDIGQAAKILKLPFGRNSFFKELRNRGILFKNRNEPKQEFIHRGYFELREKLIERNNHEGFVVVKTLVTQKGLFWLSKVFGSDEPNKPLAKFY